MSGGYGPWLTLALLGFYHGLNPGMGWLFSVALGMQRGSRKAVWSSLLPIATGHLAAVIAVIVPLMILRQTLPLNYVKWMVSATLIGFGIYRLIRSRHPRWVGMQVGFRDLVAWSFLMAWAHGAGLMLAPVLLGATADPHSHAAHLAQAASSDSPAYAAGVAVHTLAYLATTGAIALLVYERFGLAFLRTSWVNLDLIWSVALIVTGIVALWV